MSTNSLIRTVREATAVYDKDQAIHRVSVRGLNFYTAGSLLAYLQGLFDEPAEDVRVLPLRTEGPWIVTIDGTDGNGYRVSGIFRSEVEALRQAVKDAVLLPKVHQVDWGELPIGLHRLG